jgi:hypothetical protein
VIVKVLNLGGALNIRRTLDGWGAAGGSQDTPAELLGLARRAMGVYPLPADSRRDDHRLGEHAVHRVLLQ